jgi:hypothetical protein
MTLSKTPKTFCRFGILVCLFAIAPLATRAQQKILWEAAVTPSELNVYTDASTTSQVATVLKQNYWVNVVLELNSSGIDWCRIEMPGEAEPAGYVLCKELQQRGTAPEASIHSGPNGGSPRGNDVSAISSQPNSSQQAPIAGSALTDADILSMNKAGLPSSVLIAKIKSSACNFDTSPSQLQQLKAGGVPDDVILAMVEAPPIGEPTREAADAPAPAAAPAARTEDLPDEVGVYIRQHGKLVAIEPEIVNWRTGGVAKSVATLGLDKGHVNGTVSSPHSQLTVSWTAPRSDHGLEFYIRCAEGNSASEYQLLRLWDKSNRREFRAVTGGILHKTGGAKDNDLTFDFEKVGSRTYKIVLNSLGVGDYGFLAPGAVASANVASNGKIYTFRILE